MIPRKDDVEILYWFIQQNLKSIKDDDAEQYRIVVVPTEMGKTSMV